MSSLQITRTALAADAALGCGNFLAAAVNASRDPNAPKLHLDEPYRAENGRTYFTLSLSELQSLANAEAAAYHAAGVRAGDVVAVSVEDGPGYLVHFVALTSLGAIAALINPNRPPETAAAWATKVRAIGLVASARRLDALAAHLDHTALRFVSSSLPRGTLVPPRHIHSPDDVVLLCHSSGTTGVPKAVTFRHHGFFHGVRQRLAEAAEERVLLSALPHSHSAGIAFPMLALLRDEPVVLVRGDQPQRVLAAIERLRATTIVAFPHTFVEIAQSDCSGHDLSSVRAWVNTGDAAHHAHVKKLVTIGGPEGSAFIDGLGSSEMGFSLFRIVYTRHVTPPPRCVGAPLPFVDAQVLGEDGEPLGIGVVGRLGVCAPTVTGGYWLDPALTESSRAGKYWLTGDLVYKDAEGRFFHVDRTSDVVRTSDGPMYTLLAEEILQRGAPDLVDVCVVGARKDDGHERPVALIRPVPGCNRTAREWLRALDEVLSGAPLGDEAWPALDAVFLPEAWSDVPVGPTGKVLKRLLRARTTGLSS
jgi:acyl-CoA synthetase (AMP-forming)/AMP-acid ligase II